MQSTTSRVCDGDCRRGIDFAAYVQGEFRADEQAEAEAHLVECADCRSALAAYIQLYTATELDDDDIRLVEEIDALTRPLVREQIRTALAERRARRWRSMAVAAVITIAGALAVVWLSRSSEPSDLEKGTRALNAVLAQSRPSQFRLAGAGYSEYGVMRGGVERQVDAAEHWLRAAVTAQPSPEARHQLARALLVGDDVDEALELLESAWRAAPDDVDIAIDYAVARAEKGDLEGALDGLDAVLRDHPDRPDALFDRAILKTRLRRFDDARADWKSYLALDPSSLWTEEADRSLREISPGK